MSTARALRLVALLLLVSWPALGEEPAVGEGLTKLPELALAPDTSPFVGKTLRRVEVVSESGRLPQTELLRHARVGRVFSVELARQALRELLDTGRYADARALVEPVPGGVALRLVVLPRRVIRRVDLFGSPLPREELLRERVPGPGGDLTALDLPGISTRLEEELKRRGFPESRVVARAVDTDDPLDVVLSLEVRAGSASAIVDRWFGVWPDPDAPGLRALLATYAVDAGERADSELLAAADQELQTTLRARGFHRAVVSHRLERRARGALLRVNVQAGPLMVLTFEGNRSFDQDALEESLALDASEERDPVILVERLRDFYEQHGFFDVRVKSEERGAPDAGVHELLFAIHEGSPVRVVAREYPCLTGERTPAEVGSEIDSFLSDLPGSELIGPVDENAMAELHGPNTGFGHRKTPPTPSPWSPEVPHVNHNAIGHRVDKFRSRG
jgi:hypothetical protein